MSVAGKAGRRAAARGTALVAAFAALVVAAYSSSLGGEFQFDDTSFAVTAATVGLERFAHPSTWIDGLAGSGRPLTQLTFAVNWAIAGAAPRSYHLVNVGLHVAAALLVFLLTRRTLLRLGARRAGESGALAAALFAVHPLHTQAVSYVSQRAEVLASVLYLATLLLLVASDDAPSGARRWALRGGALLGFVLALAAKQIAVTLPLAWVLHATFFPTAAMRAAPPAHRRLRRAALLLLAGISLAASLAGVSAARGRQDAGFGIGWIGAGDYLLTQLRVVPTYLRLLAWPSGQTADWAFTPSRGLLDPPATLLGLGFLLALAGACLVVERRTRASGSDAARVARFASFGILWFLLLLLPSSSVFPLADLVQEHRPYLASFGILAPVAAALVSVPGGEGRGRRLALGTAVLAIAVLSAATWSRNRVWRSEIALWTDAASKSPGKGRVQANLGYALARAGRDEEALAHLERALRLAGDPSLSTGVLLRNTAACLTRLGRPAEAAQLLEGFARTGGAEPETLSALALAYLALGRGAEGERIVRQVVALNPDLAAARDALGRILVERGEAAAARDEFAAAVRLAPWDGEAQIHLAEMEYRFGRIAGACGALRAASEAPAAYAATARTAVSLLAGLGCDTR